jgi:hypothetical protein
MHRQLLYYENLHDYSKVIELASDLIERKVKDASNLIYCKKLL